jgi:hypothetical protein
MLKKSLIAVAVLAIALPAIAGDMKLHDPWPTTYVPQTLTKLDVELDVGFYIHVVNQNSIKVTQNNGYKTYAGCSTTDVITNFAATLSASAVSTSAANGSWSVTLSPDSVPVGTTAVEVCVSGTDVAIEALTGGTKNVKVAEVTISVVPQ